MTNVLPFGSNAINYLNSQLKSVNQYTGMLLAVLDRTPEQVSTYSIGIAQKVQKAEDWLMTDKVLRLFDLIEAHLKNIETALDTNNLFDNHHSTYGQTTTLVEALMEKWDAIVEKRRQDNYLNMTFGFRLDEIGVKMQRIYKKIPLYTQKNK